MYLNDSTWILIFWIAYPRLIFVYVGCKQCNYTSTLFCVNFDSVWLVVRVPLFCMYHFCSVIFFQSLINWICHYKWRDLSRKKFYVLSGEISVKREEIGTWKNYCAAFVHSSMCLLVVKSEWVRTCIQSATVRSRNVIFKLSKK